MRHTGPLPDGRQQRGLRNRSALVQALFDLIGEGVLQPTAQQIADRAGFGIRTVFRHFEDMESLLAEVNERVREHTRPVFREPRSAGSLSERARALFERRVRLFERIAPYKRSGNLQRWRSPFVEREHALMARELRADLLAWLPEIRSDRATLEALDAAVSFEAWDRLRSDQRLGCDVARSVVERLVQSVLDTR